MSKLDVALTRLYKRFGITRDNDSLLTGRPAQTAAYTKGLL